MKKFAAGLLTILMILGIFAEVDAAAATAARYVVTASSLNIRERADSGSRVLAKVSQGTVVNVHGKTASGKWYKVSCNGVTGYASSEYLRKQGNSSSQNSSSSKAKSSGASYSTLQYGSSGSAVTRLQKRLNALGYDVSVTGNYGAETMKAVKYYQMLSGCSINGVASPSLQRRIFSSSAKKYTKIQKVDFFTGGVQYLLPRGGTAYIIDCATGTRIRIYRLQGTNHFDVEPATAADTAKLRQISGGSWSWNSRPVILVAGGKYIAAAINTMPHGEQSIKNNGFNGHFCVHTTNSRTHGSNKVNSDHQASITQAYGWLK